MEGQALFEANLSSMESMGLLSARTSEALRAASSRSSRLSFSQSSGWLFEDPASGLRLLLHSRRDPQGEAGRQLDAWFESGAGRDSGLFVVLGAAGLVHVKALASRLKPGSKLFVLEPFPEILAAALAQSSLQELALQGLELRFASHGDFPALMEELRFELRKLECLDVSVFAHPASSRLDPELYRRIESAFAEKLCHESMNRETLIRFSRQWILNSLSNLPAISSSAQAGAFAGLFKGCSAIAIGAGPSLDASLSLLASLKGKFLLVAAGTALKPLLKAGIEPDFVVAVDSDPKTLRQYEGMSLSGQRLAASCNVDPRLPALFPGRSCFFSLNLSCSLNQWLESGGLLPERLSAGGTVIVSAVDFARLLGCSRIALCGVDLAMGSGGLSHSSGSVYSGRREEHDLVSVPGNWEGSVMTSRQFAAYIGFAGNFLYDLKQRFQVDIFNANGSGARIPNAKLLMPEELGSIAGASPASGRARLDALLHASPRLPGSASFSRYAADSASWISSLVQDERAAMALAKISPREAEELFAAIELRLKDPSPGSELLGSLLEVELRGFAAMPGASSVALHCKIFEAATALLEILRNLPGSLPGETS